MTTQAPTRRPASIPPCQFALELIARDATITDPRFAQRSPDTGTGYETTDDEGQRFDAG